MAVAAVPAQPSPIHNPPAIQALVEERTDLPMVLAQIVVDYTTPMFGAAEWKKHGRVKDVGQEPSLDDKFWNKWNGPDIEDPTKKVREIHDIIFRPEYVVHDDDKREDYSLELMRRLVKNPREGHSSQYEGDHPEGTRALVLHGKTKAGPACILLARKGVLGRAQPYGQQVQLLQRAGYPAAPKAVDVVTVVFARHVVTGERHLGDDTGEERQLTYSRCEETVNDGRETSQVAIGGFSLAVEGPGRDCLKVWHFGSEHDFEAVLPLLEFPSH